MTPHLCCDTVHYHPRGLSSAGLLDPGVNERPDILVIETCCLWRGRGEGGGGERKEEGRGRRRMGREEGTREEGNELRRNRRSEIHEALVLFLKNNFYSLKVWVCVGM